MGGKQQQVKMPEEKEPSPAPTNESNHPHQQPSDEPDLEEWELVDEEHVMLDLVGIVGHDTLKSCDASRLKLIGLLEDEQPVLQLDRFVFVGKREHPPGTCVLFECSEGEKGDSFSSTSNATATSVENETKTNTKVKLACCTTKKLVMNQAFLSNRVQVEESGSLDDEEEDFVEMMEEDQTEEA